MKLFTVKLTEADRAKLEALRASYGHRSEARTIRWLIEIAELGNARPLSSYVGDPGPISISVAPAAKATPRSGVQFGPTTAAPGSRLKQKR